MAGEDMESINLARAFKSIGDYWSPKVIGQVNDQYVKVAKLKGQLTWHRHQHEDELFLVIRGRLVIQLEGDRAIALRAGELFVVPRGVLHNPIAEEECRSDRDGDDEAYRRCRSTAHQDDRATTRVTEFWRLTLP